MSRQVGAAIMTQKGEIISLGCNEVPKPGGGTYWEGDTGDARDITRGREENTLQKRLMVTDILARLQSATALSVELNSIPIEELAEKFIDTDGAVLKESRVMDSLEFGRGLHAEMCALTNAARLGRPVAQSTLYCTTFPCHNCAKHIVGSGVKRVVYQKPYPKSFVSDLYPDSIHVDKQCSDKRIVTFDQFIGITSRRFSSFFAKGRLKDPRGSIISWDPRTASPVVDLILPIHPDLEIRVMNDALRTLPSEYSSALSGAS